MTHNESTYSRIDERVKEVEEILAEPSKVGLMMGTAYRIGRTILRSVFKWK